MSPRSMGGAGEAEWGARTQAPTLGEEAESPTGGSTNAAEDLNAQ